MHIAIVFIIALVEEFPKRFAPCLVWIALGVKARKTKITLLCCSTRDSCHFTYTYPIMAGLAFALGIVDAMAPGQQIGLELVSVDAVSLCVLVIY